MIAGAGFAGLAAARRLAHAPVDVLLLDRNNYHVFWPLLYQVGTAALESSEIAYPIRSAVSDMPNVQFRMGALQELYPSRKVLVADGRELHYDQLILALGSSAFFLDIPGAEEHAVPLKSLEDGLELRNQILSRFELAATEHDEERRRALLTFVIVGAGATGVEFAGALAELVRSLLRSDYRELGDDCTRVILVEALDRVLLEFPSELGDYAHDRLRRMGVEVRLEAKVKRVEATAVHLEGGEVIQTDTVVWSAGVRGNPLAEKWGLPATSKGTLHVDETLRLEDWPSIFVTGDLASFEYRGKPLPGIAPVALQQGRAAAANVLRQLHGRPLRRYAYREKGRLAVVGRNHGVADLAGRQFTGFPAWMLSAAVHLWEVPGIRNRLQLTLNWADDYMFRQRPVRLVFPYHDVSDVVEETERGRIPSGGARDLLRPHRGGPPWGGRHVNR